MIYGDRLRWAREKLGLSRMKFAVIVDMTERSIANIENCKDGSKKLSFDKMKKIIEVAELPEGYWFYNDDDFKEIILGGNGSMYSKGTVAPQEAEEITEIAKKLRDNT